jgi:predicted DsbA family dithiol-disulfide isomerase
VKVEIWSDVVCPWCYIGKRRFERALTRFEGADAVDVIWRSFQLNPDHPPGARQSHDAYLAAKLGATLDQVRAMDDRVVALAAAEGLHYDFERYQVVNTFDAHRLTHLAKARALGAQIQERLLRAQLVEGEILDDVDTLVRLGVEVGLSPVEVRDVLGSDAYAHEVRADLSLAQGLGIRGVPFFAIDRRFGISGAQEVEHFVQVLEHARNEAAATGGPTQ